MKKILNNKTKIKSIFILIVLFLLLFLDFSTGFFNSNKEWYKTFDKGSEALVINKIKVDKIEHHTNYGLCRIDENNNITDYSSSIGLQGYVSSFLSNKLNIKVESLNNIVAFTTAIVILLICINIEKKYSLLMSVIFYIVFLLSPWIVNFSNNLYWVPFTWFIPVLFGLLLSLDYKKSKTYIPLIALSIFIKCLCGYEYISSIMLLTITFMITDLFIKKEKKERKEILKTIIITGLSCILAFSLAIGIHGMIRGEGNLLTGVQKIYKEDVLRRTSVDSSLLSNYDPVYFESLTATHKDTIQKYLYFNTELLYGINGNLFLIIIISSIVFLTIGYLKKYKNNLRNSILFIMLFLVSFSWLYLAKGHSYIHTHLNYVLWYFGFIQICLYIIIDGILKLIKEYIHN